MDRAAMIRRVRAYTRDLSSSIFRQVDITDFIQEGIDRIKGRIPQLKAMTDLTDDTMSPTLLPAEYHHLLPVYASARCFGQDERHYQASTLMNEFEIKLEELLGYISDGTIEIRDPDGNIVDVSLPAEYVKQAYFDDRGYDGDDDEGVNGVG